MEKKKVNLVYKSRSLSSHAEEYLSLSKCEVTSGLMKGWKLKNGSPIFIEKPGGELVLTTCWSCKASQLGNDSIYLNKNWAPYFEGQEKHLSVTNAASARVSDCIQAELFCIDTIIPTSIRSNVALQLFLHLEGVYCRKGLSFSMPVTGVHRRFEIHTVKGSNSDSEASSRLFYRVTASTKFILRDRPIRDQDQENIAFMENNKSKRRFAAYPSIVKRLEELLTASLHPIHPESSNLPVKGILLHGLPGIGKTTLAEDVISYLNCNSMKVDHGLLLRSGESEGEAVLRRLFVEAKTTAPTVIVIDHFDLLFPPRSGTITTEAQKRLVTAFLVLMDELKREDRVVVLAISSKPLEIDEAAKRAGRIDLDIEIPVPSELDRHEILTHLFQLNQVTIRSDTSSNTLDFSDIDTKVIISEEAVRTLARNGHGMVGSDLLQVVKECFYLTVMKKQHISEDLHLANSFQSLSLLSLNPNAQPSVPLFLEITVDICEHAVKKVSPSSLREVTIEVPSVRWDDIGGMDNVKRSLRQIIELPLKHPQLFQQSGMTPLKGILLYGPPGCSKTLMAKAVATETAMNFLAVRGPELLSKWLGDSEKAVQSLFRKAATAAPSIVFFDEIDALAGMREESSSGVSDRVLSQLLIELDGINSRSHVVVIAATNRPDMLDKALIRPGRIDRKIYVPPPDEESRRRIIELELKKLPHVEIDVNKLVELSQGFSGAEVVAFCNDAVLYAIEKDEDIITMDNLEASVRKVKPQISRDMLQFYETFSS